MKAKELARRIAMVQGVFYVVTGLWPVVHLPSFEAVTGAKTDDWLVVTVGLLIAVVGGALLLASRAGEVALPMVFLGAGSAAVFTFVDVWYYTRGVIPAVYLLDALAEVILLLAWGLVVATAREG
jgi:hypothetical protein